MIDLNDLDRKLSELERRLDEALSKETRESLTEFINKKNMETNPNEPIDSNLLNTVVKYSGLTKREYFASMAMKGIITNKDGLDIKIERIAESAVDMADSLIEELNKTR